MKLKSAITTSILIASAIALALIALGVGYKPGDKYLEYEGDLWCVSNFVEKEPRELLSDGQPTKHELLEGREDWIRKDQITVDPSTNNPEQEAMNIAQKEHFFEEATKDELISALERGDEEFFTHHFNSTAIASGHCITTVGKWINDATREECFGTTVAGDLIDNIVSGKCGDLQNPNAISAQEIKTFLEKNNSPMKNDANAFMEAAQKYKVNPALLLGISGAECSFGTAGAGKTNLNPGNVKSSSSTLRAAGISFRGHDSRGHVIFSSWRDGIIGMAEVLRRNYLDKGRTDLIAISQHYLEGNKQNWINGINSIIKKVCKS